MRLLSLEYPSPAGIGGRGRFALGLLLAALPLANAADSDLASLSILVTDIEELRGDIVVAVFGSRETFDLRSEPVAQARLPVGGVSAAWSVDLEAAATYAVIIYHDLNGNGEIDMRRFGRPREPYGFSTNARGRFGPPSFDEVSFVLPPAGMSLAIAVD